MVIPSQIWTHDHCKISQHTRLSYTNVIMKVPKNCNGNISSQTFENPTKYLSIWIFCHQSTANLVRARELWHQTQTITQCTLYGLKHGKCTGQQAHNIILENRTITWLNRDRYAQGMKAWLLLFLDGIKQSAFCVIHREKQLRLDHKPLNYH